MHRNGRLVDDEFLESETLYRRFPPQHYRHDMKVPIYAVELPDVSVNRSKHGGKMIYVLYDVINGRYLDHFGIVSFTAGNVPQPGKSKSERRIDIRIRHVPEELNFFHAEIQAHDAERGHLTSIEEEDEAWIAAWRISMRRAMTVVREPR